VKARLQAVQKAYWSLVLCAVIVLLLPFPLGHNRTWSQVVTELTAFQQAFSRPKVEASLSDFAKQQGTLGLDQVIASLAQGSLTHTGIPKLTLAKEAQPIVPTTRIELRTLADALAHGQGGVTAPLAMPQLNGLATALAWRITREAVRHPADSYALVSVVLSPGAATSSDIALEMKTHDARIAALHATTAFNAADRAHTELADLYESRRKWKATWKVMTRTAAQRNEAKATLDASKQAMDAALANYEALAKRGESWVARNVDGKDVDTRAAAATVSLRSLPSGQALTLVLAVAMDVREVAVPPLTGTAFRVTQDSGLWPDVKDKTADEAIAIARARFTWHTRGPRLGGIQLGGLTLLHGMPLLLPLLMWLIVRRARASESSYNPFDLNAAEGVSRVGSPLPVVDGLLAIGLPSAACAMCAYALVQLGEVPALPVLALLTSLGLGVLCFVKLSELRTLVDDVLRSHGPHISNRPPPAAGEST
jgi:hypothetical protein